MHSDSLLFQAFIYLLAAVVSVPIAKRAGLGSVLGYLMAGVIIGPFVLALVGNEEGVMHFAEFGVVMMLFLIGLELRPALLWRMRGPILGLGGLQVLLTSMLITAIAMTFGLVWQNALVIGMTLALSSTAIVLQTLNEKGLMKTGAGESCFSVLLFQDIAVIPMLAVLPLLAVGIGTESLNSGSASEHIGWINTLKVVGAVASIIFIGRYVIRHVFRVIAETKLREIFTATALLLVIGIAVMMETVGLSPALGTFLAGVVLADSEYRHELESNIEPFKGLLLGLFFISVGASIDFGVLFASPIMIVGLVIGLIGIKFIVLFLLSKVFKMTLSSGMLFSFALAQGGEFAFVLFSFATQNNVISTDIVSPLIVVVALTMLITPLLIIFYERFFQSQKPSNVQAEYHDEIEENDNPVLIAGYGRFGQIAGRLLASNGFKLTILDNNASHIEALRGFGNKIYFGDASRIDLLELAGARTAKIMIIAIEGREKINELVETVKKNFPNIKLLVRAENRTHAFELLKLGVEKKDIYRVTFGTSLELGRDALRHLGFNGYRAQRAALLFKKHDEEVIEDLYEQYFQDYKGFRSTAITREQELNELFASDLKDAEEHPDEAWQ